MTKKITKSERINKAELRNKELKAQMVTASFFAYQAIAKASNDHCRGSGIILEISYLGGKSVFDPVMISDGLSEDTIAAIKRDLMATNKAKEDFIIR